MTNIVFDIEAIRGHENLKSAPDDVQIAWTNYAKRKYPDHTAEEAYLEFAGLFPEFGKIVCISVLVKGEPIRSFTLDAADPSTTREKAMLLKFCGWLGSLNGFRLIGHYIKKFDIPYVLVRCVANEIKIPAELRMFGVKPWESQHWDTKEIWTGGVYGSSQAAGLEAICAVLNIQSPKAEFSGNDVSNIYYSGIPDAVDKIAKYCERDVLATHTALVQMATCGMFNPR